MSATGAEGRLQHFTPVEAKTGRRILGFEPEGDLGEEIGRPAQQDALPGAVQRPAARYVAGADHEMPPAAQLDHGGNVAGIMGEIRVHRHDPIDLRHAQSQLKTGDVCRAQPELASPVNHVDPTRIIRCPAVGLHAGAIRRIVVDDDHSDPVRQVDDLLHEGIDVVGFVVCRDDNFRVKTFGHTTTKWAIVATMEMGGKGQRRPGRVGGLRRQSSPGYY